MGRQGRLACRHAKAASGLLGFRGGRVGWGGDEGDPEARRLAPDELQEPAIRQDLAAAVPGGAEVVALDPPAPFADAPVTAEQVVIGQAATFPQ